METQEMVRQLLHTVQDIERIMAELGRNDLLLIESMRGEVSPKALSVAAATVQSTLYSLDALADRTRTLAEQVQSL